MSEDKCPRCGEEVELQIIGDKVSVYGKLVCPSCTLYAKFELVDGYDWTLKRIRQECIRTMIKSMKEGTL